MDAFEFHGTAAARRLTVVPGAGQEARGRHPDLLALSPLPALPRTMRIESWSWTGDEDRFVVRAWSPELGEILRFVTTLTSDVRAAIARRASCSFRLAALVERIEPFEPAPGPPPGPVDPWIDAALSGDPLARRLLRRTAERAAQLAGRGGPARMMAHLPSIGGGERSAVPGAAYLLRGAVRGLGPGVQLGRGGAVRRGVLDAGRVELPLEAPAALCPAYADGAAVECEAVLTGEPA